MIDSLESRRLLADFASVNAGGTLSVVGTSNNDTIAIDQNGSNIVARRGSQTQLFVASAVKRFWVNAFAGNDRVTINVARPSTIIGSSGNDTLTGGNNKDSIDGSFGNDVLSGRGDADILNGADGNDTFFPGGGTNTGDAGTGKLTIDFTGTTPGGIGALFQQENYEGIGDFRVNTPASRNNFFYDVNEGDVSVLLRATEGDDNIEVTPDANQWELVDIPITVDGGAGNDVVFAGRQYSNDRMPIVALGGEGNDTLASYREAFHTTLTDGGDGDDFFYCPGGDFTTGAEILGGGGYDTVEESFTMGRRTETYHVPQGVERLYINSDRDTDFIIYGNDLSNELYVSSPRATIYGAGGDDIIEFESAEDQASEPMPYRSYIEGGAGNDTITVIDHIPFRPNSADTLLGNSGNDSLTSNAGNDNLFGGSGKDTLVGGAGRDLLHGQDGDDRIFALDNEIDTLDGGAGFDRAQRDNAAGIVDSVSNVEQFI